MDRPEYIKGNYSFSKFFDGISRLAFEIGDQEKDNREQNRQDLVDTLLFALEYGASTFITSPPGCIAPDYLCNALKQWKDPAPFISLRIGSRSDYPAGHKTFDFRPEAIRPAILDSLHLMGTSRIDLLIMEVPQKADREKVDEIVGTLNKFREERLADHIGIAGNNMTGYSNSVNNKNIDVLAGSASLNACNLDAMNNDIPLAGREKIAYFNTSPFHHGLISNRLEQYSRQGAVPGLITFKDINTAVMVSRIAKRFDMTLPELAIRFAISLNESDHVVCKAANTIQVKEVIDSWAEGPLPESIFNEVIDNVLRFNNVPST